MSRDRLIGLCVLAVGLVTLLSIRHNRGLTLAVAVMCILAVALLILDVYTQARQRRQKEALRKVPWTTFTEPTDERGRRRVGVRRVAPDGTVLARDKANDVIVNEDDAIAKLDAQGDALNRATQYNEDQVWM